MLGLAVPLEVGGPVPCTRTGTQALTDTVAAHGEKPALGGIYSSPDSDASAVWLWMLSYVSDLFPVT